ncbi:carbohydrate ABC transporter permease [Xylanivirga thermophila]|uniref:carbohydrate ABC transporter permease n=1 Tax=Xylanivirga thermophila TaxID=2496273 RepID=UPI001A91CEC6|nr:sugar ABC transporter permease [Xylanivirga thermophila]
MSVNVNSVGQRKASMHTNTQKKSRFRTFWNKYGPGYIMLAPFMILFVIFALLPVITAAGLSFTNYNILQAPKWAGITNYRLLFTDDDVFLIALRNTLLFALVTGPIGFFASFFFAWIIDQLKWRNAFSLAFYAPSLTSGIAMSVVWLYFFSGDRYGFLNNILINLGIINEPVLWNMDPNTILPVIIIVSIWMSMGTGFLVFLAGFQNIPKSYYEAAAIDGMKNKFQELVYITFPCMKPQLLFGAINAIVGSLGVFDVAVSIAGMPSPNYAGHTIVAHLYDYAFIRFNMGYASAVAVVLFLLTFLLGRLSMKIFSSKDE